MTCFHVPELLPIRLRSAVVGTISLYLLVVSVAQGAETVTAEELLAPVQVVEVDSVSAPKGVEFISNDGMSWSVRGKLANNRDTVVLRPEGDHWDFSKFSYLRIDVTNAGSGLVWIQGRLDNQGAENWAHSTSSEAFILPGERATLGFPYPRPWEQNDSPAIYNELSGKPNGHRTHWKQFDPRKVKSCRLQIISASPEISLEKIEINLSHRYGMDANRAQAELPYLDRFGQVRTVDWPGKLRDEAELKRRSAAEEAVANDDAGPASFNKYGGWATGPHLNATGFFRVAKHGGKWWLIDPAGRLFFSNGMNTVGFYASTPLTGRAELFAWIPESDDPLFAATMVKRRKQTHLSFLRSNLHRTFGPDWRQAGHERIHNRLRRWGMNTIGAWSDSELLVESPVGSARTPYTQVLHVWRRPETRLADDTPDPFAPDFGQRVRSRLQAMVDAHGHDPWCLGVFIDNETDWHGDLVERVFAAPAKQPAKTAFIERLKEQYESIQQLNQAWKTELSSWQALVEPQEIKKNAARNADFKQLYGLLADRYYRICRDEMRRVMPGHLYLGSRVHTCPAVVAQAAARYVDVYSMNSYVALAGTGTLPRDADKPVMIAEYHFAAPDRGVPGVGLSPVGDQLQRSRAFAAFVVAGLQHPRVVGTHWFTYADQSAAGRPYENYQIGFVDVTDTPYPLITKASRNVAERMYEIRASDSPKLLQSLEALWRGN